MKRREFLFKASSVAAVTLTGCGGSSDATTAPAAPNPLPPSLAPAPTPNPTPAPTPTPPTAPAPVPPPSGPSVSGLPLLTLHSTQAGTFPYLATAYPHEGAVPSGQTLESPDDPSLAASVLSRWPDGSAAVVVIAGEAAVNASASRTLALRAVAKSATPLTAARVGQLVTSIAVNAGAVGSASLTTFASPEKVWWANERVICCRYRLPVGNAGLEAVIDVHAFASNRALVEVVVENGKVNSASPAAPTSKSYTGATVSVNGQVIATVSNPVQGIFGGAPFYAAQAHEAFRAWHCATWVGGDPGTEVTHDTGSMQWHPLLFRVDQPTNQNMATRYGAEAYRPWATGRHRAAGMGAGGDHDSIGALPQWDTHYLQTGDRNARRAVIANALAALSFNINYRDSATGLVPTFDQTAGRTRNSGTWPETRSDPGWEVAHHPAEGLMAFLCHPSPAFIELAQKIAVWNGTWSDGNATFGMFFQTRGRAWCVRSLAHALFLTPSTDPWRSAAQGALGRNVAVLDAFRTSANNPLGVIWDGSPTECLDMSSSTIGFQQSIWQHHWIATELHKIAAAKLLTGANQSALNTLADWACSHPVRYINESAAGEWRYLRYKTTIGRQNYDGSNGSLWGGGIYTGPTPSSLSTWREQHAWFMTDGPPPRSGPWMVNDSGFERTYSSPAYQVDAVAHEGVNYVTHFWAVLCMAVERNVPGADAAWATVLANVTNLAAWRRGFAADPRQGTFPRNK
jgi:hypothetical protein